MAALDNRVRLTHEEAHNRYQSGIPLNAQFKVGDDRMDAPGGGTIPGENINCRCTVFAVIERTKDELVDGFPEDLEALEEVRNLGGTTGAKLVRHQSGKLFVQKTGNNREHLLNECHADSCYRALGVKVPKYRLYFDRDNVPIKLSEFIEDGMSLNDYMRTKTQRQVNAVLKKLRADFTADAYLQNWDVVGLELDNILVDKKGVPWRIDNGGALRFRAQGAPKLDGFMNPFAEELWTMRERGRAGEIFGDMDWYDIMKRARYYNLGGKRAALFEALPPELAPLYEARFNNLQELAKTASIFQNDDWRSDYVDGFSRDWMGIRKLIAPKLPAKLKRRGTTLIDEQGRIWDHLRGDDSVIYDLEDYMRNNGGDFRIIRHWSDAQGGSSWSSESLAAKLQFSESRSGDDVQRYYWGSRDALPEARDSLANVKGRYGSGVYERTLQQWHAFNYEFLKQVDFTNNVRNKNLLRIMRTERLDIILRNHPELKPQDHGREISFDKRQTYESASIFESTVYKGEQMVLFNVPHHRVIGFYGFERGAGSNRSLYLDDTENEVLAILDGIKGWWWGRTESGRQHSEFWRGLRGWKDESGGSIIGPGFSLN